MRYVTTWEQLALEEGREEGITFGRLEGEREMLLRQLTRKFGVLPPAILERVQSETDLAQLEMWSLNLLEAKSLPEVGL